MRLKIFSYSREFEHINFVLGKKKQLTMRFVMGGRGLIHFLAEMNYPNWREVTEVDPEWFVGKYYNVRRRIR